MDMQKTAKEIGLFETAVNLVAVCDSSDVQAKVGASMPLPDANITKKYQVYRRVAGVVRQEKIPVHDTGDCFG